MKKDYKYLKPINRSNLRVFLGKKWYTLKRYYTWYFKNNSFASSFNYNKLSYKVFTHRTPILRKLKDIDMWLQFNKKDNLKIALKELDHIVIKPGEVFSYWRCIGKPSKSKGYKKGMVLEKGKVKTGIGGGLCQLSNLLFWALLHTPLTLKERFRHGFDVFPDSNRKLPFGSGATCVYNYRDLQFKNNTEETYQLVINIINDYLIIDIYSDSHKYLDFTIYESYHEIQHTSWGGYIRNNEVRRKVLNLNGEIIDDQYLYENHALMMYDPLLTDS
ncbi:MAG TPA: VanW family protein [Clostridia bacterium]|nr:VanW family protein [Clostridia bacterium]